MSCEFEEIVRWIQTEDVITIFRHEHPDCDAVGSQFALKSWIEDNFPTKQVYAVGNETCTQGSFPACQKVDEEIVRKSLAIVLDTANEARIDDSRSSMAKFRVKIDHHPNLEPFGDLNAVNSKAAATCEILTSMFVQYEPTYALKKETAQYLYQGLLTDTLCFRTTNTTWHTLAMASELAKRELDLAQLNRDLFDQSLDRFRFGSYVRSKLNIVEGHIGYIVLEDENLRDWNMTGSQARNHIDEIGHIQELEAWCIFTHSDSHRDLFDASLRSKHIAVNEIAQKYKGGGHKNAAGIKNLSRKDIEDILMEINTKIKEA